MSCSTSAGGITGAALNRSVRICGCARGVVREKPRLRVRLLEILRLRFRNQPPERRRPRRVGDEMHARVRRGILDPVLAPVVEDPGLARRHVHALVRAVEAHLGPGDHGYVHAHAMKPVVVHVAVLRHGSAAFDPHQARARPDRAERREHLLDVGTAGECRGGLHLAGDGVVGAAADGDEPRGGVAFVFAGMARPGRGRQRLNLDPQPLGVEADRQPEKGLG